MLLKPHCLAHILSNYVHHQFRYSKIHIPGIYCVTSFIKIGSAVSMIFNKISNEVLVRLLKHILAEINIECTKPNKAKNKKIYELKY